ncbi:hypothetical protein PC112_g1126 [Phytophthora cactorum]|nr:hypothetical protein PC112_g1126 [Phytophthora cactorum]
MEIPSSKKGHAPPAMVRVTTTAEAMETATVQDQTFFRICSSTGKRKRAPQVPIRPRRPAVLKEDDEDGGSALTNEAERDGGGDTAFETPAFAIDADPNLTDQGANQCTGLNFDEDPGVCEEPEGEVSVPSISALKSEHIIQTNSRVPPKKLRSATTGCNDRLESANDRRNGVVAGTGADASVARLAAPNQRDGRAIRPMTAYGTEDGGTATGEQSLAHTLK